MAQESKMMLTPRAIGVQKDFRGSAPEECVSVWATKPKPSEKWTRWLFQIFFIFTPIWGNDPI